MSWVKIDDSACEHPKLLQAGAKAAWLWLCCLSYCNRQKRKDGVIPKAKIGLLYPGVGLKEARQLVAAGLLHESEKSFTAHGYHEYQPSAEVSAVRSIAGKQGGIKSGEARRSKREAIASDVEKQDSEAQNEPPTRPLPSPPDPGPTPKPPDVVVATADTVGRCPVPLPIPDESYEALKLDVGLPRSIAEVAFRTFAVDRYATGELRRLDVWISWALTTIRGRWSSDKAGMRAAAETPKPEPDHAKQKLRTADDILAAQGRGAA